MSKQENDMKKCACRCGGTPTVAQWNNRRNGWKAGQQKRFMPGHNNHGPKRSTPTERKKWLRDMIKRGEIMPGFSRSDLWDKMMEAGLFSKTTQFEDIGFSRLERAMK